MSNLSFLERLKKGETLVADGATGSNLQQRGLQHGDPSEAWLLEKPEEVIRLHRDFIQAGADILLTNTFGAGPLRLKEMELGGRVVELNRLGVELARQAAGDTPVLVAGSMGPVGRLLQPYGPLSEEEVYSSYGEQAQALNDAGADLLVIETQFDLGEAALALKAARAACKLPVVVSFSYDSGTRTMMGVRPIQMANEFKDADVLGINCGRSLEDNQQALLELRSSTDLPIWFKPNAGLPHLDENMIAVYDLTPEAMGAQVSEWLADGAQVVGGCCGTSPEHLVEIARAVKS
jgi:5-methyltetrahydrofolate--homocysteine methyltransferase